MFDERERAVGGRMDGACSFFLVDCIVFRIDSFWTFTP